MKLVLVLGCRSSTSTSTSLTVVIDDPVATKGVMHWQGRSWPVVIGQGAAWPDDKREGDGKTPLGKFALRGVYGYAPAPPRGTKLPYTQVDDKTFCVDDPASRQYTEIVHGSGDWKSAEPMLRRDAQYQWVIDVAHNPERVPGRGSCIFLHVWPAPDAPTIGCTAMAEPELARLIGELEPGTAFVVLPRADYKAREREWGLPALEASDTLPP